MVKVFKKALTAFLSLALVLTMVPMGTKVVRAESISPSKIAGYYMSSGSIYNENYGIEIKCSSDGDMYPSSIVAHLPDEEFDKTLNYKEQPYWIHTDDIIYELYDWEYAITYTLTFNVESGSSKVHYLKKDQYDVEYANDTYYEVKIPEFNFDISVNTYVYNDYKYPYNTLKAIKITEANKNQDDISESTISILNVVNNNSETLNYIDGYTDNNYYYGNFKGSNYNLTVKENLKNDDDIILVFARNGNTDTSLNGLTFNKGDIKHTHDYYNGTWKSDDNNHWQECKYKDSPFCTAPIKNQGVHEYEGRLRCLTCGAENKVDYNGPTAIDSNFEISTLPLTTSVSLKDIADSISGLPEGVEVEGVYARYRKNYSDVKIITEKNSYYNEKLESLADCDQWYYVVLKAKEGYYFEKKYNTNNSQDYDCYKGTVTMFGSEVPYTWTSILYDYQSTANSVSPSKIEYGTTVTVNGHKVVLDHLDYKYLSVSMKLHPVDNVVHELIAKANVNNELEIGRKLPSISSISLNPAALGKVSVVDANTKWVDNSGNKVTGSIMPDTKYHFVMTFKAADGYALDENIKLETLFNDGTTAASTASETLTKVSVEELSSKMNENTNVYCVNSDGTITIATYVATKELEPGVPYVTLDNRIATIHLNGSTDIDTLKWGTAKSSDALTSFESSKKTLTDYNDTVDKIGQASTIKSDYDIQLNQTGTYLFRIKYNTGSGYKYIFPKLVVDSEDINVLPDGANWFDDTLVNYQTWWKYDKEEKTLTIGGIGDTPNYVSTSTNYHRPWLDQENTIRLDVTNLVIEEGVSRVGNYIFTFINGTTNIKFPKTLTIIGDYAFFGVGEGKLVLPKTITNIGTYAFAYNNFDEIEFEKGFNATLSKFVFHGSSNITKIVIQKGMTLGEGMFSTCNKLQEVVLPEGLTTISNSFVSSCENLKTIKIPSTVTKIGYAAFAGASIENIVIPKNVAVIESIVFNYDTNLKSLTFTGPKPKMSSNMLGYHDSSNVVIYVPEEFEQDYRNEEYYVEGYGYNYFNTYVSQIYSTPELSTNSETGVVTLNNQDNKFNNVTSISFGIPNDGITVDDSNVAQYSDATKYNSEIHTVTAISNAVDGTKVKLDAGTYVARIKYTDKTKNITYRKAVLVTINESANLYGVPSIVVEKGEAVLKLNGSPVVSTFYAGHVKDQTALDAFNASTKQIADYKDACDTEDFVSKSNIKVDFGTPLTKTGTYVFRIKYQDAAGNFKYLHESVEVNSNQLYIEKPEFKLNDSIVKISFKTLNVKKVEVFSGETLVKNSEQAASASDKCVIILNGKNAITILEPGFYTIKVTSDDTNSTVASQDVNVKVKSDVIGSVAKLKQLVDEVSEYNAVADDKIVVRGERGSQDSHKVPSYQLALFEPVLTKANDLLINYTAWTTSKINSTYNSLNSAFLKLKATELGDYVKVDTAAVTIKTENLPGFEYAYLAAGIHTDLTSMRRSGFIKQIKSKNNEAKYVFKEDDFVDSSNLEGYLVAGGQGIYTIRIKQINNGVTEYKYVYAYIGNSYEDSVVNNDTKDSTDALMNWVLSTYVENTLDTNHQIYAYMHNYYENSNAKIINSLYTEGDSFLSNKYIVELTDAIDACYHADNADAKVIEAIKLRDIVNEFPTLSRNSGEEITKKLNIKDRKVLSYSVETTPEAYSIVAPKNGDGTLADSCSMTFDGENILRVYIAYGDLTTNLEEYTTLKKSYSDKGQYEFLANGRYTVRIKWKDGTYSLQPVDITGLADPVTITLDNGLFKVVPAEGITIQSIGSKFLGNKNAKKAEYFSEYKQEVNGSFNKDTFVMTPYGTGLHQFAIQYTKNGESLDYYVQANFGGLSEPTIKANNEVIAAFNYSKSNNGSVKYKGVKEDGTTVNETLTLTNQTVDVNTLGTGVYTFFFNVSQVFKVTIEKIGDFLTAIIEKL